MVRNDKITIEEICKMAPEEDCTFTGIEKPEGSRYLPGCGEGVFMTRFQSLASVSDTRPSVRHWGNRYLCKTAVSWKAVSDPSHRKPEF